MFVRHLPVASTEFIFAAHARAVIIMYRRAGTVCLGRPLNYLMSKERKPWLARFPIILPATLSAFLAAIGLLFYPPAQAQDHIRINRSASQVGALPTASGSTESGTTDASAMPKPAPSRSSQQPATASQSSGEDNAFSHTQMRISLPTPAPAAKEPLKSSISTDVHDKGQLTQVQLQKLAAHDIVLIIDKSGSMGTRDCPMPLFGSGKLSLFSSFMLGPGLGEISRWDWCLQQAGHMAKETAQVLPNGFSVILFDSRFNVFPNVKFDQLPDIFQSNQPGGGTELAPPLMSTFGDYFQRKRYAPTKVKPLVVGIITDGCPADHGPSLGSIAEATHHIKEESELTVIFFLIGARDHEGQRFVEEATHDLRGAKFNVVKSVPFQELLRAGLAESLANNLK